MIGVALTSVRRKFRELVRRDDGVATFEFVLLFPLFVGVMVSGAESGLLLTRYAMLERSLDMAVRTIRLSSGNPVDPDVIRQEICDTATVFEDCMNNLTVEMTRVYDSTTDTWAFPANGVVCVDRDENAEPVVQFQQGAANEVMFVRACVVVDLIFPTAWLGGSLVKDPNGNFQVVAKSAFAIEPDV
ncbi:Flp pilus assembly protein TadG [Maritimibacter sp. 55A14]|uniref:TadE/TadG family type IV pilus assembly protein n=1 Tax=Maritimibacter sp. 55A14 TaxID=2174844 RepID=UPI000D610A73|nr:Flp pilus assembly protein TadG [Maritimibacter sp. 55A14]PWE30523.1 Flp pilus assembly protein TadG [Maritimibacter sp. 55A14]